MNKGAARDLSQVEAAPGTQVLVRNTRKASRLMIATRMSDGVTILDTGGVQIWDGADLCFLRDAIKQLIVEEKRRLIGLDLMHVKHLPTGFFGMLFDWHQKGISIRLYFSQPHVQNMRWFRQFFIRADSSGVEGTSATVVHIPAQAL
jgi:hypothetical protein